jgi:hypothetical protein
MIVVVVVVLDKVVGRNGGDEVEVSIEARIASGDRYAAGHDVVEA